MVPLPRASRRRVLITGCSSGLSHRTALHLAQAGMDVVATRPVTNDLAKTGAKEPGSVDG
jgi:NAD(P)-dependent dehydrogenase (short-subunit alcohol dehydrogenase family)